MDKPTTKYFRTYHLPWTLAATEDDKILTHDELVEHFYPMADAYISLKRDGENTTIGKGYSHARSLDSKHHWSRDHIKALAAQLYNDIPTGWRICGENLIATHSITYGNLDSFFEVFSVWDEHNNKLSLEDTIEFCQVLDLTMVPILGRGAFKTLFANEIRGTVKFDPLHNVGLNSAVDEGYVVCNAKSFHWDDARKNIAKCVRKNHVQTDEHWMHSAVKTNSLRSKE
jgi:hypothetical protein